MFLFINISLILLQIKVYISIKLQLHLNEKQFLPKRSLTFVIYATKNSLITAGSLNIIERILKKSLMCVKYVINDSRITATTSDTN